MPSAAQLKAQLKNAGMSQTGTKVRPALHALVQCFTVSLRATLSRFLKPETTEL